MPCLQVPPGLGVGICTQKDALAFLRVKSLTQKALDLLVSRDLFCEPNALIFVYDSKIIQMIRS